MTKIEWHAHLLGQMHVAVTNNWLTSCVCAAVALYTFLGFAMDGPASMVTSMIGLQIAPHFNKPFVAESLTAFWGKRWNLTISNCLRGPIYDPIYEGQVSGELLRASRICLTGHNMHMVSPTDLCSHQCYGHLALVCFVCAVSCCMSRM